MTSPGQAGYGKAQTKEFYTNVRERVARVPGVESVSWSSNLPLWARSVNGLEVEGRQKRSRADAISTILNTVDTEFFETAGGKIDSGREFTNADRETSNPVAIVNEKLAHDYWPGGEALGKRIRLPDEKEMRQIVGIARNRQLFHLGGAAAALRLCASGTTLHGWHGFVCSKQRRSAAGDDSGQQRTARRHAANSAHIRANRTRNRRRRLVSGESGGGAAERVWAAGAWTGQHWAVWDYGVLSEPAKTRDRVADGFRRGTKQRAPVDIKARHVLSGNGRGRWFSSHPLDWTVTEWNALWHNGKRSGQCSGRGVDIDDNRIAGVLLAGPLGQPRRSAGGVTRGLTGRLPWKSKNAAMLNTPRREVGSRHIRRWLWDSGLALSASCCKPLQARKATRKGPREFQSWQ